MERKRWRTLLGVRLPALAFIGFVLIVVALACSAFPSLSWARIPPSSSLLASRGVWDEIFSEARTAQYIQPEATVCAVPIAARSDGSSSRSVPSFAMLRVIEQSEDPPPSLLLVASGDLMLRSVPNGALDEVQPLFQEADYRVGNLECVLTQRGMPVPQKPYTFRDSSGLAFLQQAGIDLVSLANNHSWDYQWEGLEDSFQALDRAGIQAVGFADLSHSPSITVEKGGIRIAFLAFAEKDLVWWPFWFQEGVGIPLIEESQIVEAVKSAQAEEVDHVIIFLHWGEEGSMQALTSQTELAHRLVEAGASLILGSHSHTWQGVETYRGAVIAYSLGDCLFGPSTSEDCGQLLEVRLQPKGRLEWCKIVGLTMREGILTTTWIRQLETRNNPR